MKGLHSSSSGSIKHKPPARGGLGCEVDETSATRFGETAPTAACAFCHVATPHRNLAAGNLAVKTHVVSARGDRLGTATRGQSDSIHPISRQRCPTCDRAYVESLA
jgi:hypothetical protein